MLFNSAEFIFVFLPVTLACWFLSARLLGPKAGLAVLVVAALVFYGRWEPWHLAVLIGSIAANYLASQAIVAAREAGRATRGLTACAIAGNLALLGVFKYSAFFSEVVQQATGIATPALHLSLPLGISFFTFTQITYLADAAVGKAERVSPLRYALFVTYFPHLLAGPILHHRDILPQFEKPEPYRFDRLAFMDGASLFLCGLAKKVILADAFAPFVRMGFGQADGGEISFFAAWGAALSYTFQLYFDFSGYCDMALGLARMMRIDLPINFNSPYKATSIIDFWRRWHITLSRFLRDYLYIPLGGSRHGEPRRYLNLFLTMLLGGLWHGAGWTFIVWGALHGAFLAINHAFRKVMGRDDATRASPLAAAAGWALTFLCVVVGWVFFRATDMDAALSMLRGMAGLNGAPLPDQIARISPLLQRLFGAEGMPPGLADGSILGLQMMVILIATGLVLCVATRNLYAASPARRLVLAALCTPLLIQAVFFERTVSPFLYFRF